MPLRWDRNTYWYEDDPPEDTPRVSPAGDGRPVFTAGDDTDQSLGILWYGVIGLVLLGVLLLIVSGMSPPAGGSMGGIYL